MEGGKAGHKATSALIGARIQQKLTQRQLAERARIKQPSLARVEGGSVSVSVDFLGKIARAIGKELEIQFV